MVVRHIIILGVEEPFTSQEQVRRAVRMLDWSELSWLSLRVRPDWFMTITGGKGRFNVYVNVPGTVKTDLVNPEAPPGWAEIVIDGETSRIPKRLLVDELTTLCAAEQFVQDGGLVEDFIWE
jgi:hypothetical protein